MVAAVGAGCGGGRDPWAVQRLLVNADPSNVHLRRPQLDEEEEVAGAKRLRHPAPLPLASKVNAKDISKYFVSASKQSNGSHRGVNSLQQHRCNQQEQDRKREKRERTSEEEEEEDDDDEEDGNEDEKKEEKGQAEVAEEAGSGGEMGSNLSRHNGKGLTGRRTQSSGNLCDPKGKLNSVGKILVPCSGGQRER